MAWFPNVCDYLSSISFGEIDALHFDVSRMQAENTELTHRLTTLERLVREHGWE
jgi:hypothetical protein